MKHRTILELEIQILAKRKKRRKYEKKNLTYVTINF